MSLGSQSSFSDPGQVWGTQRPYLEGLYQRGIQTLQGGGYDPFNRQQMAMNAGNFAGGISNIGQMTQANLASGGMMDPRLTQSLYSIGGQNQGLRSEMQAAGRYTDPRTAALGGLASGQTQNQYLGQEIQAGLGDISRNFRENIMPGINLGSALSGTSGGSRQGIAQGIAARGANRQAADFVTRMRSQNYGQGLQSQLQALGQVGGLEQARRSGMLTSTGQRAGLETAREQAKLGALGQLGGLQAQANQNIQAAMQAAPDLVNLGFSPETAYWQTMFSPLQAYGNIIGAPTTLGGASGGSGWDVGGPSKEQAAVFGF